MSDMLLILPAYNEEKNIGKVLGMLKGSYPEVDILVVDDGSTDGTSGVCRKMGVPVARHKVNLGLASGIRTGMKYALSHGYSYAMQFDADGQHDETMIRKMHDTAVYEGADIVIGSRYLEGKHSSVMKSIGGSIISFCIKLTCGAKITDPTSGMRLYNRQVMENFALSSHYSPEPDMLAFMIKKGAKVMELPVVVHDRSSGKSYLDITESIRYMFRMVTSILIIQWLR